MLQPTSLRLTHAGARRAGLAAVEIVCAVGIATAGIAVLQGTAPAAGLGILYLLAVLTVAIRRGERPALLTFSDATPYTPGTLVRAAARFEVKITCSV